MNCSIPKFDELAMACSIPKFDEIGFPIDADGLQIYANRRVGLAHNLMCALAESFNECKSTKEKERILDRVTERIFTSDRVKWELKVNKRSTLPILIETLMSFQEEKELFRVKGKRSEYIKATKYYFREAKYWINKYLKDEDAYQYL
jgi:hypothetical protein